MTFPLEHHCSEETTEAWEGVVKEIADERGVSVQALYQILGARSADHFNEFFETQFKPTARRRPDRCHFWLNKLQAYLDRSSRPAEVAPEALACDVVQQFNEWLTAKLRGESWRVQRKELSDIITAAMAHLAELEDAGRKVGER